MSVKLCKINDPDNLDKIRDLSFIKELIGIVKKTKYPLKNVNELKKNIVCHEDIANNKVLIERIKSISYDNDFVPDTIVNDINNVKNKKACVFSLDKVYDIAVFYDKDDKIDYDVLVEMCYVVMLMRNISKSDMFMYMNAYMSNEKKYLHKTDKVITNVHINSGSTLVGSFVNIWRKESFIRTVIHELVHFYEVDGNSDNNSALRLVNKVYTKAFNIKSSKIYNKNIDNEAYTEFLCLIIHSVYYSVRYGGDYVKILSDEIKKSYEMCSKLFVFNNIDSLSKIRKMHFKQETSAFAYFVEKTIMLSNVYEILNMMEDCSGTRKQKNKVFKYCFLNKDVNHNYNFYSNLGKSLLWCKKNNILSNDNHITFSVYSK